MVRSVFAVCALATVAYAQQPAAQLHAVVAHCAVAADGGATLRVGAGPDPLALVLGSVQPITWNLDLDPDAELRAVTVVCYGEALPPSGLPEGVELTLLSNRTEPWLFGDGRARHAVEVAFYDFAQTHGYLNSRELHWQSGRLYEDERRVPAQAEAFRASWDDWPDGRPDAVHYVERVETLLVQTHRDLPTQSTVTGCRTSRDAVRVTLAASDAPRVVVLWGEGSTRWTLALDDGASLAAVVLVGGDSQDLRGLPPGVPVFHLGILYAPPLHTVVEDLLVEEVRACTDATWGDLVRADEDVVRLR